MKRQNLIKQCFIGTSGWSYAGWRGLFYPEEIKPNRYLEYYANHFNCVELNASFYRFPKIEVVRGWYQRTPAQFRICPKLSRLITHIKKLNEIEDSLVKFIDLFAELKKKLGPILIQLPPSLPFDSPYVAPFFELLKAKHAAYQFAIEARHPSWVDEEAFKLLESYQLAWVIANSGGIYPEAWRVTADFVYVRFHGPRGLYSSKYKRSELREYAIQVKSWLQERKTIWAFFNNDVSCFAPVNAREFNDLVASELGQ